MPLWSIGNIWHEPKLLARWQQQCGLPASLWQKQHSSSSSSSSFLYQYSNTIFVQATAELKQLLQILKHECVYSTVQA